MHLAITHELEERFGLSGQVSFRPGNGGLPKMVVATAQSEAEIYLHGAHVTHFQRTGEKPMFFMSGLSSFAKGKPIRGGVPVIFPWFGPRADKPSHGFVRLTEWRLIDVKKLPDAEIRIALRLPREALEREYEGFQCEYVIKVHDSLELELNIWDESTDHSIAFESCLHPYFSVGDIEQTSIAGLKYTNYHDQLDPESEHFEKSGDLRISEETDRIYFDTQSNIQILDPVFQRRILLEKRGSASTVVWNPWTDKARRLSDLGDDDYRRFVCVEPGNLRRNGLVLAPGQTATMHIALSTERL